MGLEGVEIIIELEEQFQISIPNEDCHKMRTAGDIHDYLVRRMAEEGKSGGPRGRCRSQFLFYRLRRAIARARGHPKKQIRPESPLNILVPKPQRGKAWEIIAQHAGLRLPPLERPDWLVYGALFVAGLIFAIQGIQIVSEEWPKQNPIFLAKALGTMLLGAVAVALISLPLFMFLTKPLVGYFPRKVRTMRQLVKSVASLNEGLLATQEGEDIWPIVQRVIAEVTSLNPETIKKESTLIKDLKID